MKTSHAIRQHCTEAGRRAISILDPACGCDQAIIRMLRGYLREHFPRWGLRDFHERARCVQAGLLTHCADHHVVSVTDWENAYYAVVPSEYIADPPSDAIARLSECSLAEMLRAHTIVFITRSGLTPL